MSDVLVQYQSLVDDGELRDDPAQRGVAVHLARLSRDLSQYRPERKPLASLLLPARRTPPPRGLYIHGGVGRGKSMLMDLFFEAVPAIPGRRVHFHEFMQDVHGRIHDWRQSHKCGQVRGDDPIAPVANEIFASARLLCFDEFQVSDITDAMILGRLFEALFALGAVVVATSNTPPEDLYRDGLNRGLFLPFVDLLTSRMEVVELDGGTDYRLERLNGMEVYYSPLGQAAARHVDQAWLRLTDAPCGEPCELSVNGRVLRVPQAARGVARFRFAELCGAALGAADYLKLATTFHTLVLEQVPALSAEHRNEARRLMTLVDALYEKKVKLIMSAAKDPHGLYVPAKNDGTAFERTVSRLFEMQSADYMALGHAT